MPPHARFDDFLSPEQHRALLKWTLGRESYFRTATVSGPEGFKVDETMRIAAIGDLGPLCEPLERRFMGALPDLRSAVKIGGPMPDIVEIQLAAHGPGAFYKAHADVIRGADGKLMRHGEGGVRILSAVYYFNNEPKGFSGGALRIYRLGIEADEAGDGDYVDLEPKQNSLIVFPSWALHEVRPVNVPSGEFRDYRFAINCWFQASMGD